MIKNIEFWTTERCNSRCLMCDTWRRRGKYEEIGPARLGGLLLKKEFKGVESVQLSGGEPALRRDLSRIGRVVLASLPRLKILLLATNGTNPEKVKRFFHSLSSQKNIKFALAVSLDGDRDLNKKLRGIDSFDSAVKTIRSCRLFDGLDIMILSTITRVNCTRRNLLFLKNLARGLGCGFSFRQAYDSPHHRKTDRLVLTSGQNKMLVDFIEQECEGNAFLSAQKKYLLTGKMPLMAACAAGSTFVNIRPNGDIFPCINSEHRIGDAKQGLYEKTNNHHREKCCPCCDEACFYPMLKYQKK